MFTEDFYWWELNLAVTRIRAGCQRASTRCRFFVLITALDVSAIIKHLEDQQIYGYNYLEGITEPCKKHCLQTFICIIQTICQKMESLRQLQVSLRRSVRKFISISVKDGKDWRKSSLLNVISSLKTTLYDVNDCITVGLKLSDTLAWYGSILSGSDHNFVRSKECHLDLQANFHHLKHNESEQNPHKVKQRSAKWHSIRDQAYATESTKHKALGLDTNKKQQEHFDFVVNHKMKKDELTQEEIENIQFGTNNEINAIATLVCKIMPLYCPNTCYTEFGCHVIDYKGKPVSIDTAVGNRSSSVHDN